MIYKDFRSLQAGQTRKRNLFGQVVEELGSRIVRGEVQPGQTLPESELCRDLGASRTVVREALKSLSAKGLVDTRTRTGTRVLEPTHWNLLDLDVLSWRYAAMPRMQFLRERFHRAVLAAAHNELLAQMGGVIGAGLLTSFRISSSSYDVFLPYHGEVFEAIRYGRPAAARAAMEKLLVSTREFLEGELEQSAA
jgi:DNA-binding FadR family transcriptional regulator